jgi:hypothetical protein
MKQYKTLTEWLQSNPPEVEKKKLINLINKGATNPTRKEIYELERYYRKLSAGENHMKKLGYAPMKETQDRMKEVKAQINELSEELPALIRSAKKDE